MANMELAVRARTVHLIIDRYIAGAAGEGAAPPPFLGPRSVIVETPPTDA